MTTTRKGLSTFYKLLPFIGLVWIFMFWRVHLIDVNMPYFIDELNHINRARIVWTFSDLHVSTTPGKFLLYYYIALFDLPANQPGFMARTAVVIITMIGAAGTYALTRTLFNHKAGLLSVALLSVFPFLVFHERLTLSDPLTASFVVLVAWWSIHFALKPTLRRANILAVMICFMLLGKILAGPIIFMPAVAILLLSAHKLKFKEPLWPQIKDIWEFYRPAIMRVIKINAVIWGFILVFYVGRGLIDPDNTNPIVDDYIFIAQDRTSQLEVNYTHLSEVFDYLWGTALFILTILAIPLTLIHKPRHGLYILAGIAALWIPVFVIAARPNSRYLTLVGHFWIVLVAGGVASFWALLEERFKNTSLKLLLSAPMVLLVAWALGYGADFSRTYITEPTELELPEQELNGYYRNFTGFALRDGLYYVADQEPISEETDKIILVGLTRACQFLPYHIPDPDDLNMEIFCLERLTKSSDMQAILDRYGDVYAVWEQFPEQPTRIADPRWIQGRAEFLTGYVRPYDGIAVNVYKIHATGPRISGVQTP